MRRFDEIYRFAPGEKGTKDVFEVRFKDLDERLNHLEEIDGSFEVHLDDLVDGAQTRIDTVLLPAFDRVLAYQSGGFLTADIIDESAVEFAEGEGSLAVHADSRELFTPSPYIVFSRASTTADYAVAERVSYDKETGVLEYNIIAVIGDDGPHEDVVIWATAGSANAQQAWLTATKTARDVGVAAAGTAVGAAETATEAAGTATSAAGAAATSNTQAGQKADLAERWAEEAEDTEVETDKYSAKHWALKAEASAEAAASFDPDEFATDAEVTAAIAAAVDPLPTESEMNAAIAAAITALIGGAPAALNVLNELAAALGNDANFSATVTAALATKAPLASPTFTGTPAAPTATGGTNTTQIATTAFVIAALAAINAAWLTTGTLPDARLSAAALPYGTKYLWIGPDQMSFPSSNGASSSGYGVTDNSYPTALFGASVQERAHFTVALGQSWNGGSIIAYPVLSHATGSGNTVWNFAAVCVADLDNFTSGFGAGTNGATDTNGTADRWYIAPGITVTPSGSAGGTGPALLSCQIQRMVAAAGDTLTVAARLHGVILAITTDRATD